MSWMLPSLSSLPSWIYGNPPPITVTKRADADTSAQRRARALESVVETGISIDPEDRKRVIKELPSAYNPQDAYSVAQYEVLINAAKAAARAAAKAAGGGSGGTPPPLTPPPPPLSEAMDVFENHTQQENISMGGLLHHY